MKQLDDVFHRLIIALERLEAFLEIERFQANANEPMPTTAVGTSRDLHNDDQNVPNRETLLGEVQLQLTALYYQTKLDDKELFLNTQKYFLKDLLQWYGGRGTNIPYNEVDAFVLPIVVALSRQVKSVADIMSVVKKYVATIKCISDYDEHQRFHAVMSGWTAYQIAMERNAQETHDFLDADEDVVLTSHNRSSEVEGYKRLYLALTSMFDQPLPAKVLCRTISTYLPEVTEQVPNATEDNIEKLIADRLRSQFDVQETKNSSCEDNPEVQPSDDRQVAESAYSTDLHNDGDNAPKDNNREELQQTAAITGSPICEQTGIQFQSPDYQVAPDDISQISEETKSNVDDMDSDNRDSFVIDEIQVDSEYIPEEVLNEQGANIPEQTVAKETVESSVSLTEDEAFEGIIESEESISKEKVENEEDSFFARLANKVQNRFSKK